MELSIIIVNWNSCEFLRTCLASIRTHLTGVTYEVVVIDAGSFDDAEDMLRREFPETRFVQSQTNPGFGLANNAAVAASTGSTLLFLNPDTEVRAGAIQALLAAQRSLPQAGIVGARLLNSDGTLQESCVQSFPTVLNQIVNSEFLRRRFPKSRLWGMSALFDDSAPTHEVEGISGACMLMPRQLFDQVGGFSTIYFMYAEDMDLAYKVREAGFRNYYVRDASIVHHGGQSTQRSANLFAAVMLPEAVQRFFVAHRGRAYSWAYRGLMMCSGLGRLGVLGAASVSRGQSPTGTASFQKWLAIVRWSLKRDGIVQRYYT